MNINVPPEARDHFWHEPEPGSREFWGFRWKPPCAVGDKLTFRFDKKPVAEAVVDEIQKPGLTSCDQTGRFKNLWKVYWTQESFRKLEEEKPRSIFYMQDVTK